MAGNFVYLLGDTPGKEVENLLVTAHQPAARQGSCSSAVGHLRVSNHISETELARSRGESGFPAAAHGFFVFRPVIPRTRTPFIRRLGVAASGGKEIAAHHPKLACVFGSTTPKGSQKSG